MYYYGYFRDTDCKTDKLGNLYKVIIITNYTKNEIEVGGELLLSSSPFIVSYTGDDNIFKGYKCSTATVGMYLGNYNFEFNNTSSNNVYVALCKLKPGKRVEDDLGYSTDSDLYEVVWVGFGTPNAFSQDYNSSIDYFELECQDALSTLKYYNYEKSSPYHRSFADIITKYIGKLGTYKTIYFTSSLVIPTSDLGSIPEFIYISDRNFLDDDDNPEKVLDVLDSICSFLGVTMIPWGDAVYFIDYNSLEHCEYYSIELNERGLYKKGLEEFHHTYDIDKDNIISANTNLSIGTTYNKVTVIPDLYEITKLIHDGNDKEIFDYRLGNDTVGDSLAYLTVTRSDNKVTELQLDYNNPKDKDNHRKVRTFYKFKELNLDKAKKGTILRNFIPRWYETDKYRLQDGQELRDENVPILSYDTLRKKVGCCYADFLLETVDSFDEQINGELKSAILMSLHNGSSGILPNDGGDMENFENKESISDRAYEYRSGERSVWADRDGNEILDGHTGGYKIIRREDCVNQRLFDAITDKVIVAKGNYINIKGNISLFNYDTYCIPYWWDNKREGRRELEEKMDFGFVWASLSDSTTGKWWDGEKWKYPNEFRSTNYTDPVTGEITNAVLNPKFRIPLKWKKKSDKANGTFSFGSSINWDIDVDVDGYVVPVNVDGEDSAKATSFSFSLYRPWGFRLYYWSEFGLLENFDMSIVSIDENSMVKEDDSNPTYTNTPFTDYIEDYPEINLKINSWNDKNLNHSSAFWFYKSSIDFTGNPILANYDMSKLLKVFNKSTGQFGRPEELILSNYCRQYSTPQVILEVDLLNSVGVKPYSLLKYSFLGDKKFCVDGMTIDYSYDTTKLKLIERK